MSKDNNGKSGNQIKPLFIDIQSYEENARKEKINSILTKESTDLDTIFSEINQLLKLNFEGIASKLINKPDRVFKIDRDIDTVNIREAVSNFERTCFYENGRIFVYSNFLSEVVFGIQNWVFYDTDLTYALSNLFVDYRLDMQKLTSLPGVDVFDLFEEVLEVLDSAPNFRSFFDLSIDEEGLKIYPRDNLIDSLLSFKQTLIH